MSILLDTPTTADYDLSAPVIVLSHTMAAAGDVRVVVRVGTIAKPCVELAGVWNLYFYVSVGGAGYNIEPYPQELLASSWITKLFVSKVCDVPAGAIVGVMLKSPNAGDTDVTVTAEIWHVSGSLPAVVPNAAGGLLTFGTGAGQINPDGTGKVPSSNAALAASYTADRAGKLDNLDAAVSSVGNSEDTILNSESQVYNTDTADGSTVVNEES